jgi:hypothetical protein
VTGFYGKRQRSASPEAAERPRAPPRAITTAEFLKFASENGYVVKPTAWYLRRLRKAIAARLILPTTRDLYQEPSFTLYGFPAAVLQAFADPFLHEPSIELSKPLPKVLKLEVRSLRVLHEMLQLQLLDPQYEGGLRFVRPAKVKYVRAMTAAVLPFVMVAKGDDLMVSFKYILIDSLGAITPPKEMEWSDIDDRRARIVVLQQMRAALAREKKTPRLTASLRRQVDPDWEGSEEEDAVEEADDNATEVGEEDPPAEGEPAEPAEPPEPEPDPPDSPPPPPREM